MIEILLHINYTELLKVRKPVMIVERGSTKTWCHALRKRGAMSTLTYFTFGFSLLATSDRCPTTAVCILVVSYLTYVSGTLLEQSRNTTHFPRSFSDLSLGPLFMHKFSTRTVHEENCCTCGSVSHLSEVLAQRHHYTGLSHFHAGSATCCP